MILRAVVLGGWIALSLSAADKVPNNANQPSAAFVFGAEWHLVNEEEHPWCGFGRMDDVEVGYLVPDIDDGDRLINEEEYEKLVGERLEDA